ncbi:DUF1643 domain-containing protein [Geomonas sp. Red69]|uniref:DUF1643 domain-containing protein n=1 Tax=Geomonas diazotrophica TaxID=2843197 RepID=UPI001C1161A9|nr:DUF1643 domain-containing protein [Geomonas diazotrophica]MBU5637508.1 DUF1643 domain-containing protein [Geomonas diazotrophica]
MKGRAGLIIPRVEMGRIYKYPSYVKNVEPLGVGGDPCRRLCLTINLDRRGSKQALFIMMNPSKATATVSDKTINAIIKYTYEKCDDLREVSKIIVFNLYAVYETASGNLADLIAVHGHLFATGNDKLISPPCDEMLSREAEKSSMVVIAWGKPQCSSGAIRSCGYYLRILEVLKLIKAHDPYHLGTSLVDGLFPRHPRGIDYSWSLSKVDVAGLIQKIESRL